MGCPKSHNRHGLLFPLHKLVYDKSSSFFLFALFPYISYGESSYQRRRGFLENLSLAFVSRCQCGSTFFSHRSLCVFVVAENMCFSVKPDFPGFAKIIYSILNLVKTLLMLRQWCEFHVHPGEF